MYFDGATHAATDNHHVEINSILGGDGGRSRHWAIRRSPVASANVCFYQIVRYYDLMGLILQLVPLFFSFFSRPEICVSSCFARSLDVYIYKYK